MLNYRDSTNPARKERDKKELREKYASKDALLFPCKEGEEQARIKEEVQKILRAKDRRASLLKLFFREFLSREATG